MICVCFEGNVLVGDVSECDGVVDVYIRQVIFIVVVAFGLILCGVVSCCLCLIMSLLCVVPVVVPVCYLLSLFVTYVICVATCCNLLSLCVTSVSYTHLMLPTMWHVDILV